MFRLNCHHQGADTYVTESYSSKIVKVINAQLPGIIHHYKNTKENLPYANTAMWFNNTRKFQN